MHTYRKQQQQQQQQQPNINRYLPYLFWRGRQSINKLAEIPDNFTLLVHFFSFRLIIFFFWLWEEMYPNKWIIIYKKKKKKRQDKKNKKQNTSPTLQKNPPNNIKKPKTKTKDTTQSIHCFWKVNSFLIWEEHQKKKKSSSISQFPYTINLCFYLSIFKTFYVHLFFRFLSFLKIPNWCLITTI